MQVLTSIVTSLPIHPRAAGVPDTHSARAGVPPALPSAVSCSVWQVQKAAPACCQSARHLILLRFNNAVSKSLEHELRPVLAAAELQYKYRSMLKQDCANLCEVKAQEDLTRSFASVSALLCARMLSVCSRSSFGSRRIPSGTFAASL